MFKKVLLLSSTLLMLVGCSSTKTNTIKLESKDFNTEAVFTNGVLTKIVSNGEEFNEEDVKINQGIMEYDANLIGRDPMLHYFEVLNKTAESVDGKITLNGKDYSKERIKLFEEELNIKTCTYSIESNHIDVNFVNVDKNGKMEELEIVFSSPKNVTSDEQKRLELSYMTMLNDMFQKELFTLEDVKTVEGEEENSVSIKMNKDFMQKHELEEIDMLDMLYSLKTNEFTCK